MSAVSLILPPDIPPERLIPLAIEAESAGIDEVWVWEDCFATSGLAPAAAILATTNLRVGIGLLPTPLRNVALVAMEVATLAGMFPGRLLPGIGHGVQSWMGQAGARVASPLTLLDEYTGALRALLAGERVTSSGRYVQLDGVQLRWPPEVVPPLHIGAQGPKTLAFAGRVGDAVIITGSTEDAALTEAVRRARRDRDPRATALRVVAFTDVPASATAEEIRERVRRRQAAGATAVPLLAIRADGTAETGDALTAFIRAVAASQM